ncbi:MAG TPA: saccharopine dehydrogenase NADP-binding domain-containing protein [Actinomycetota bacterium]|nr:saccharopine dehydrogenase NADP-binding domain-containing protein [Actinomycetota bacterium]
MPDILLFGATGYTGRLTAHALARRGADFAIAGRSRERLEALAAETGNPDVRIAAVGDVDALVAALRDVKVMITCVGPFGELGWTAVDAALRARVHYIDSTGEGTFIRQMIDTRMEAARNAGIAMVSAMGFDEVPADAAATIATEGMKAADLVLTYAMPTAGSRGTVRSAVGIIGSEGAWVADGERIPIRAGQEQRWSPMPPPLGPKPAVAFPLAEGQLAPLHLNLHSLKTFLTTDPMTKQLIRFGLPVLKLVTGNAAGRGAVKAVVDRLPEGPNDRQRHKGRWTILAEASSPDGWRNVALSGRDVYGLTAEFLSAGALALTEPGFDVTGVVSPVQAVGIERWRKEFVDLDVVVDTYEQR